MIKLNIIENKIFICIFLAILMIATGCKLPIKKNSYYVNNSVILSGNGIMFDLGGGGSCIIENNICFNKDRKSVV